MGISIGILMYQSSRSKGQELVAQRMVKWLRRLGHEAWLLTSTYHDGVEVTSTERYTVFSEDSYTGLPTVRIKGYKASWPPRRIMLYDLPGVLEELKDKLGLQALITHSTLWNGPVEAAIWASWTKLRAKYIEDEPLILAHMSHFQPPDPLRYTPYERMFRVSWNHAALRSILMEADLVLCTTPLEAEDMISLGARPASIRLFPGGLDDEEARRIDDSTSELFLSRYSIPRDRRIIAYLGTVEERKNPLSVVRVAKKLRRRRDALFVIAGKPGDQYEAVVREASRLENIVITGEISDEEKASLIKASYLNIIMSRSEALGLTQMEFMYGGVPVVTSAVYGQRWLIRNGVDGIHVRGPEAIAEAAAAVEKLLDNPQLRDRYATNARERVKPFLMSKLTARLASWISMLREEFKNVLHEGWVHE